MNQKPIYVSNFDTVFRDAVILASGDGFAKEVDRLSKNKKSTIIKNTKELNAYYSDMVQLAFAMILKAREDCYLLAKKMNILSTDA